MAYADHLPCTVKTPWPTLATCAVCRPSVMAYADSVFPPLILPYTVKTPWLTYGPWEPCQPVDTFTVQLSFVGPLSVVWGAWCQHLRSLSVKLWKLICVLLSHCPLCILFRSVVSFVCAAWGPNLETARACNISCSLVNMKSMTEPLTCWSWWLWKRRKTIIPV